MPILDQVAAAGALLVILAVSMVNRDRTIANKVGYLGSALLLLNGFCCLCIMAWTIIIRFF
jgi:hypothetical protein